MKNQQLDYYIHDEWDAFRFELAGSLSGKGAQSVYLAWRTALSIIGERPVIVNITYVGDADERGRALLRLWHRNGARIIAGSPESRALVHATLGNPIPAPAPAAKQGWLQRLKAVLAGRSAAGAVIPASAENPQTLPAPADKESDEFHAVSDSTRLECRVP